MRQLILQSLCARRKKNLSLFFSMASIAAGVLSLTVVVGVMNGLQDVLIKNLISIEAYEYNGVAPEPLSLLEVEKRMQNIEAIAGVNVVVPFVDEFALISSEKTSLVAHVRAVKSEAAQQDEAFVAAIRGGVQRPTSTGGFIETGSISLGWALAVRLGVYRGDVVKITLPGAGAGFQPSVQTLLVSDIFYSASSYDSTWAFISLVDYAQSMNYTKKRKENSAETHKAFTKTPAPKLTGVRFGLRMKNNQTTMQALQGLLHNVRSWQENNRSFYFALKTEKTLLALLAAIIFAVIALHFRFAMLRRINGKRDDIVSLRAMGATPQNIRMWFFGESACLGALGIAVGLAAGLGIFALYPRVLLLLQGEANLNVPLQNMRLGFLRVSEVAMIIMCTAAIIMTSTYFAVRRVTKITPMQVLQYE